MRILLDENIGLMSRTLLREAGYDAVRVFDVNMIGANDDEIWKYAQQEEMFFVTLDTDFADVRRYHPPLAGVLLIRPFSNSAKSVNAILQAVLSKHLLEEFQNCLVIADLNKIRIRHIL